MLAAIALAAAIACAPMTSQNVGLVYYNGVHNCTPIMDLCEANDPMVFRAAGAFDPACGPYTYAWRFSDGSTAAGWQAFKTFTSTGVHSVELAITTPRQTFRQTRIIAIGTKPFSLFAAPQTPGAPTATFRFEAVPGATADFGEWSWNFGDGTTLVTSVPAATHSYAKSGSYVVIVSAAHAPTAAAVRINAVAPPPKRRAIARQ